MRRRRIFRKTGITDSTLYCKMQLGEENISEISENGCDCLYFRLHQRKQNVFSKKLDLVHFNHEMFEAFVHLSIYIE